MSDTSATEPNLDTLRHEIDAIDADMHALLIRRGEIIDRLVAAKRSRGGGSAFRPDREADMMRRIVERHRGHLPLPTVEHVWREIISTFTQMQASYRVHFAPGADPLAMADMVRFYFGFATGTAGAASPAEAVAAVARSQGDLALVAIADEADEPWWSGLGPDAQIMVRLPFIHAAGHPAAAPAFIVSRPLDSVRACDVSMLAVDGGTQAVGGAVDQAGGEVVIRAANGADGRHLVAVAASRVSTLEAALDGIGAAYRPVGGYFSPVQVQDGGNGTSTQGA